MMRKAISIGIVSLFAIGGLVGIIFLMPDEVEAPGPTYVSGLIDVDTSWTALDSPYIIIDNTTLKANKTLTIEAGSEIKFKDNTWLKISGNLHVKGNNTDRVVFTNEDTLNNYIKSYSCDNKNFYYNGSGINYQVYIAGEYAKINITYAQFEYSTHDYGALYFSWADNIEHTITNTIFNNNYHGLQAGVNNLIIKESKFRENFEGIETGTGIIYNSIFENNTIGSYSGTNLKIYNSSFIENKVGLSEGNIDLENSLVSTNIIGCYGAWHYGLNLKNNSIYNNNVGVILPHSSSPTNVHNNDIFNNNEFNLKVQGLEDQNVLNNWWGTTNISIIDLFIYDIYDDVSLGEAFYEPFLTESINNYGGLQEGAPWPKFRGNLRNTGLSPYDTSSNNGGLKWSFETDFCIKSSPIIDLDGTIYIGSDDKKLYAVNPDGTEKWNFMTEGEIIATPAISFDGTIYVGSSDNKLYAINPDGTKKWYFLTGDTVIGSPTIDYDGTIYFGSSDQKLYAINPDGTEKWNFTTGASIHRCPAIGSDGTIYIGSEDYKLYAINRDGTQKWNFTSGGQIGSSPAIGSDGTIYIGSEDSKLYAINSDGTEKWNYTFSNSVRSSPAVDPNGTIYIGCNDHKFYAINPDGTKKWSYLTWYLVDTTPAIGSDGTIYFASGYTLYAINPDGTSKWVYPTFYHVKSSPAIGSDGTIYIGSEDTYLYAIGEGSSLNDTDDPNEWSDAVNIEITSITLSKYNFFEGEKVTIYVAIQNHGTNSCNVLAEFYVDDPNSKGTQIGSGQTLMIPSSGTRTISASWTAIPGKHIIYAIVEDLETGEKISANLPVSAGEIIPAVLVVSTGDINIYRFEPGQERTISVEVTCYRQTVNNVHLVVLDDQNLTIDHTITPAITMTNGETTKFYLRIKAPQLPEGVEKLEKDILIQAVGDNGIFSNAEELDIVVSQSAVTFLNPITIAGAVVTGSLATLGAAAAASRRNENWKYLLLLTFAVPLYTRIHGKKTLDNFVRGQVYGHIQSKPGTHFNEIRKTLKLGNGNLAYHLRKLEKEGFIFSKRDKRYRRFYPVGVEVPEEDGIKLSKTQENILDFIERHPKSNQKEIAKSLKESQQTISYNINVLVREGFLKEEKIEGTKTYEIFDENT